MKYYRISRDYNRYWEETTLSSIIYVVPWAICDTDNMYLKKVNSDSVPAPEKGMSVDEDWCIRNVISNPDKRSKDIFAIIDVYNGYKEKADEKGMSIFSLSNSVDTLTERGYIRATDTERDFIRTKVLKLDTKKKK